MVFTKYENDSVITNLRRTTRESHTLIGYATKAREEEIVPEVDIALAAIVVLDI